MDTKISKAKAGYEAPPVKTKRCQDCSMFRAPDRCTLVRGDIARLATCKHWEKKR